MTVVTVGLDLIDEGYTAVRLARYAQMAGFSECAFWGVYDQSDPQNEACRPIQMLFDRQQITRYLAEAQEELEQVCGYPLAPRWFIDELPLTPATCITYHARRHKLIEFGVRAEAVISAGETVDHSTDPAVIGPVATTVIDTNEIRVYHPGTDVEIDPSNIVIAAGNVTIKIPRCRTVVDPDNPDVGWDYTNIIAGGPFEQTVDIKRVYNDDTTQATLVWPHRSGTSCSSACGCAICTEYIHSACGYVRDGEGGLVDVLYADLSGGNWTVACPVCYCATPEIVRIYYRAGLDPLTKQAEDAIIRLAHSKMPKPPCGCGALMEMWTRDRNVPDVLDAIRLHCPFGLSDGAWIAWNFAQAMAVRRVVSM
jgi:hypothetical protein